MPTLSLQLQPFLVRRHAPATLHVAKTVVVAFGPAAACACAAGVALQQLPRVRGGVPKFGTATPGTGSGTAKKWPERPKFRVTVCARRSPRGGAHATGSL